MGRHFAWATCVCGKRGYYSKGTAKKELRARALRGMSVYRCPQAATELWHWGHLPDQVKRGRWSRDSLGPPAPRNAPGRPRRATE